MSTNVKTLTFALISRVVEVDHCEKEALCLDLGVRSEMKELPEKEPRIEDSISGEGWSSESGRKVSGPSEKKPLTDWNDERSYDVVRRSEEEPPEDRKSVV